MDVISQDKSEISPGWSPISRLTISNYALLKTFAENKSALMFFQYYQIHESKEVLI